MSWMHPWVLALLLLVPIFVAWSDRGPVAAVRFARAAELGGPPDRRAARLVRLPLLLRVLVWTLLVLALARPRTGAVVTESEAQGIAMVVALDVSSSMLAEDFLPRNRLEVAKQTTLRFISGRGQDRIGLVAFAGEALTQVPTTTDHAILAEALRSLRVGVLEDGTAIGTGLAAATNRLRAVPGESKVVILLSDGENNRGSIAPRDAARAAAALGVRVYTVGVGSDGEARVPVAWGTRGLRYGTLPVSLDEELLTEIAQTTGGRYFRATDSDALRRVYGEIDRLERTPVRTRRTVRYAEHWLGLALAAAALLVGEWALRGSRWGVFP